MGPERQRLSGNRVVRSTGEHVSRSTPADDVGYTRRVSGERTQSLDAPRTEPGPAPSRAILSASVVLLLTVLAYLPVWQAQFIWDDDAHLMHTPLQTSLNGLRQVWLRPGFMPQYYPVVHTSFWIEQKVWGQHPLGYHLTNVLLHGVNAVLIWRLLAKLGVPGAFVAGCIFAVHPVHAESVAWVSERKNTLSTLFYLLCAMSYLRFDQPARRWAWYVIATIALIAALLSKSVTCSLPAAMLLVIWWKRGRITWRDAAPLLPWFAIGLLAGLHTAAVERNSVGASGAEWAYSPVSRLLIAGPAVCFYAMKLIIPWPLSFNYEKWNVDAASMSAWLCVAVGFAVLASLCVMAKRGRRGPLVAALLFAGTLFPALGFFNLYPMRFYFVADHFQYLASIGLIAAIVAGISQWSKLAPWRKTLSSIVILTLLSLTLVRASVFRDERTLWSDTIERSPGAWMPYSSLAGVNLERGQDLEQSFALLNESLRLYPDQAESHLLLGELYQRIGQTDDAIASYRTAMRIRPRNFRAHEALARLLVTQNRMDDAALLYVEALKIEPRFEAGRLALAQIYQRLGKPEDAIAEYRRAIQLNPDTAAARAGLAGLLFKAGQVDEAITLMQQACALEPGNAVYHNNAGAFLESRGRTSEAIAHYRLAAELKPNFVEPANALRRLGQP